jgi:peptide/nickel transport system ATP-binding protein
MMPQDVLLQVDSLRKFFPIRTGFWNKVSGYVKAVDDVSLYIRHGETLGVVGESGCGKTTLGRCIVRGIDPTGGKIHFTTREGETVDLMTCEKTQLRSLRKDFQMIFQDPNSSLDPRMTVYDIIAEPLIANNLAKKGKELDNRVKELGTMVRLNLQHLKRYPHAFSGGQRQRIGIARALATNPKFIVADESVSALDVSVQAQVINLLKELQRQLQVAYMFIAHDLGVVQHISDRVAVMYLGRIVEMAETTELFEIPQHPYTEALLSAVPQPDPKKKTARILLTGEVPSPVNPPSGCYFHPRCRYAQDICKEQRPAFEEVTSGHYAACHFSKEFQLGGVE